VVTAVVYRDPGLLAKSVTTLDVLSGGRAIFGIGPPGTIIGAGSLAPLDLMAERVIPAIAKF
jgi:alkanesulfonate monooxygenase SsuD/methylene tetrahydromethanopterin reductase-like flavin-dependent oxidoreductase (luciferase family)